MGFVKKAFSGGGGSLPSAVDATGLDERLASLERAQTEAAEAVEAQSDATSEAEAAQAAAAQRMRRRRGLLAFTEDADAGLNSTLGG